MVVYDAHRKVHTSVSKCRSCGKEVYFTFTPAGKRAPYEVDSAGQPTDINHFMTCPDAKRWTKSRAKR